MKVNWKLLRLFSEDLALWSYWSYRWLASAENISLFLPRPLIPRERLVSAFDEASRQSC
jgi:hypothetical protein